MGKLLVNGKIFVVSPASDAPLFKIAISELLFTFALVSVVLNVATTRKAAGNSYFGLAIGFTVLAGAIAVGPISGAAFNPAVALSPAIFALIHDSNSTVTNIPLYLVSTLLGGIFAGLMFKVMNPDERNP